MIKIKELITKDKMSMIFRQILLTGYKKCMENSKENMDFQIGANTGLMP